MKMIKWIMMMNVLLITILIFNFKGVRCENPNEPLDFKFIFPKDNIIEKKNTDFYIRNLTIIIRNQTDKDILLKSIRVDQINSSGFNLETQAKINGTYVSGYSNGRKVEWNLSSTPLEYNVVCVFNATISENYKGGNINISIGYSYNETMKYKSKLFDLNFIFIELTRSANNGINQFFNISLINAGRETLLLNDNNLKISLNASNYFVIRKISTLIDHVNISNKTIMNERDNNTFYLVNLQINPGQTIIFILSTVIKENYRPNAILEATVNYSNLDINYFGSIVRNRIPLNFKTTKYIKIETSTLLPYVIKLTAYLDETPLANAVIMLNYDNQNMMIETDGNGENILILSSDIFWPFLTYSNHHLTPTNVKMSNGEEYYVPNDGTPFSIFSGVGSLLIICSAFLIALTYFLRRPKEIKPMRTQYKPVPEEVEIDLA